jgi:NAD(P)-dependent dehydrogenase (short-subunit alcohol dehydrogenase family)
MQGLNAGFKRWLITGVSSGFGLALARAALARGDSVSGTARTDAAVAEFSALAPGRSRGYRLDVTDAAGIVATVPAILRDAGGIDVLVNNAGYGLIGAIEEVSDSEMKKLFDTDFVGLVQMIKAVLPSMRQQRAGHIINISSLAGAVGLPGVGVYCAAKFAVEGLSESLAGELACFGIRVTIVEPGGFRTDFAGRSINAAARVIPDYATSPAGAIRGLLAKHNGHEAGDPVKAAQAIIKAVDAPEPPLRLVLGPDALAAIRQRNAAVAANLDAWQDVSNSTNLTQAAATG